MPTKDKSISISIQRLVLVLIAYLPGLSLPLVFFILNSKFHAEPWWNLKLENNLFYPSFFCNHPNRIAHHLPFNVFFWTKMLLSSFFFLLFLLLLLEGILPQFPAAWEFHSTVISIAFKNSPPPHFSFVSDACRDRNHENRIAKNRWKRRGKIRRGACSNRP